MSAPDITPAAVQIEDQLAMSFPGALHGIADIRPEAVFIAAWNVTDFAALVAREGGPRVDLRDPRLYGVPVDGNPNFRRGFAQLVVHGQPRFAFDFTANLDALAPERPGPVLHVIDSDGVHVGTVALDDLREFDAWLEERPDANPHRAGQALGRIIREIRKVLA